MLPLSGLIRRTEVGPARVLGGCLRIPMKKVTPGKWGSLVANADAAALNSAAPAKPAKPATESDEASAEHQPAAVEDVVAKIEHETPPPAPPAGESGESPHCVAQFDESLGCFGGDQAPQKKRLGLTKPKLEVHAWKGGKEKKPNGNEAMMRDSRAPRQRAR